MLLMATLFSPFCQALIWLLVTSSVWAISSGIKHEGSILVQELGLRTLGIRSKDESIDGMLIWVRKTTLFDKTSNFLHK